MNDVGRRGGRRWDVAGMLFALVVVGAVASDAPDVSSTRLSVSLAVGFAGIALLWWRRRWPIAVAVALAFLTMFTDAVGGAEMVAVFTVASMKPWRVTVVIVVLHVLASIVWSLVWVADSVMSTGLISLALMSIPATWGIVIASRREVIDSLRERAERAESEADLRAETVRSLERQRIAREMHDALAHRISLVSLHAGALELRPDPGPKEVEAIASTIRASAHAALEDLREILGVLRSEGEVPTRPQSGLADIAELIADAERAGTQVVFVDEVSSGMVFTPSMSRTVHRVFQEGLTNARKHAVGSSVRCGIQKQGSGIRVWLENDVAVRSATGIPGSRSGIVGLSERVSLAGGRLEHGVTWSGTGLVHRLEAWLP